MAKRDVAPQDPRMHDLMEEAVIARASDGWWVAEIPVLPGVYGQGSSRTAAKQSLLSALEDVLATYRAMGMRPRFARSTS